MSIDTETGLETIEALDFKPEVPCSAESCPHPATWYIIKSCGCPVLGSCSPHRTKLLAWLGSGSPLDCTVCGARGPSVRFEPIR